MDSSKTERQEIEKVREYRRMQFDRCDCLASYYALNLVVVECVAVAADSSIVAVVARSQHRNAGRDHLPSALKQL